MPSANGNMACLSLLLVDHAGLCSRLGAEYQNWYQGAISDSFLCESERHREYIDIGDR